MLRWIAVILLTMLTFPASARPLTVMSFNVRLPIDKEPEKAWENRLPVAAAAIREARPDAIGTQELHKRQGDDLVARLPGYSWFGLDRKGGHADEHMGVFYNRATLRLVEQGDFWLSDTPDVPGSITWGNVNPRMVTWGVFERIADGRRFRLVNTHFPYREQDEEARIKSARAVLAFVQSGTAADLPTVLTGDFNTGPDSEAYRLLTAALPDARSARRVSGPAETFHNFTGITDGRRIDWILASGFTARRFATLTDHKGAVYASDHYPIVATLAFTASR